MNRTCTNMLAALCATLLVAGCSVHMAHEGPAPGVRVRDARSPQAGIRLNTVNIIDESLQKWDVKKYNPGWLPLVAGGREERHRYSKIAVESTTAKRTPTGTLEAIAVLRNRTDHPLQIEGRTQFFDETQIPVEGPTAWQRVYLEPNAVAAYREMSTKTGEIAYYYIEIREGR